jgi:magnesium transporter
VHFFVLHALNQENLTADEVDLFIGNNFLVTFHLKEQQEISEAWNRIKEQKNLRQKGNLYAMYLVVDKLVDNYFPIVYEIEDQLLDVETNDNNKNVDY